MELDCRGKCIKITLIVFNAIFWICGAGILGIGIWMAMDDEALEILAITNPEGLDYLMWKIVVYTMTGVGAFVFIVGFLGTAGATCENRKLLMSYCILTFVALAGEVACVTLALMYYDSVSAQVKHEMFLDLSTQYTKVNDWLNPYVSTWNNFQTKMECCGSYNFTDWHQNKNYGPLPQYDTVPWTCCKMYEVTDPPDFNDVINPGSCYTEGGGSDPSLQPYFGFLHNVGCHEVLEVWLKDRSLLICLVMFGLMIIQITGLVFGCLFYCTLRKS